jgi:hypothetical protein
MGAKMAHLRSHVREPGFLPGRIGEAIDDVLPLFVSIFDIALSAKHLCYPRPLGLKPVIHLRPGPQFAHFEAFKTCLQRNNRASLVRASSRGNGYDKKRKAISLQ